MINELHFGTKFDDVRKKNMDQIALLNTFKTKYQKFLKKMF